MEDYLPFFFPDNPSLPIPVPLHAHTRIFADQGSARRTNVAHPFQPPCRRFKVLIAYPG
jgi:hypothetical protein